MDRMKCECGNEIDPYWAPVEKQLFTIAGYSFVVQWQEKQYPEECIDCYDDRLKEPQRRAYMTGYQEGRIEAEQELNPKV